MNGARRKAGPDLAIILYVEDDELTRVAVSWHLSRAGFEVLGASSGEDALELAQQEPQVELVLLDIYLPGIDGVETARALRRTYPGVPLVITSGHLTPDMRRRIGPLAPAALIPKPYRAAEMIGVLQGLLSG